MVQLIGFYGAEVNLGRVLYGKKRVHGKRKLKGGGFWMLLQEICRPKQVVQSRI